jgi:hypothetical protein
MSKTRKGGSTLFGSRKSSNGKSTNRSVINPYLVEGSPKPTSNIATSVIPSLANQHRTPAVSAEWRFQNETNVMSGDTRSVIVTGSELYRRVTNAECLKYLSKFNKKVDRYKKIPFNYITELININEMNFEQFESCVDLLREVVGRIDFLSKSKEDNYEKFLAAFDYFNREFIHNFNHVIKSDSKHHKMVMRIATFMQCFIYICMRRLKLIPSNDTSLSVQVIKKFIILRDYNLQ